MMIYEHVLEGCTPVPLAGYLKALGVFRLVAEQADPDARGFWRDERFVLKTRLLEEELIRFFADEYVPTPIVSPWNGGSGFWPSDNRDGFDTIRHSNEGRLHLYRKAIELCEQVIVGEDLREAPKEKAKAALLAKLRAALSDNACRWVDGAVALTSNGPNYPPLLGTGGNDGRLDFSNNFMRHVAEVIGGMAAGSDAGIRASFFSQPSAALAKAAVGQFSPGTAGGANAGVGFEADSRVNPWDMILTVEGALMFGSATVRRHAHDHAAALSFPFTTRNVGAGSGAADFSDEANARAEFWAPLWSRAATLGEALLLMSEGRAVLGSRATSNGLDFARAVAQLGVDRGIDSFQRHAFLMRAGKAYFATPLGRVRVQENQAASLISELDSDGWLTRARRQVRDKKTTANGGDKKPPKSVSSLGRRLDEALFALVARSSPASVQEALVAIGALTLELGRRPKLREGLPPPPRLSEAWVAAADDGSIEFALSEAIAGLDAVAGDFRMPFRRHIAPLGWPKTKEDWDTKTEAKVLTVWTGRSLVHDMTAVLDRRLIESQRRAFVYQGRAEIPLRSRRAAPLAAVAAFLAGRTDDDRIAALVAALAWAKPRKAMMISAYREDALPFAYAALKPLFDPDGIGPDNGERRLIDPLRLVRLIRAGRIADSVQLAQRLARGRGLSVPFAMRGSASPLDPERLLAAILFPLAPIAHLRLRDRAYPDMTKIEEASDVS